ncbi:glycosyltransferase [Yoonia sp. GPGPB17]|uniref:glycosyltransferase n=1 Tax=Yoonia sp. GPGPB17 TaxID=3026147 RepID=UPI0030C4DF84
MHAAAQCAAASSLESVWNQPIPSNYDVEIIIVDNNDIPTVTSDVIPVPTKFKVSVFHEAKAGLVNARNRVLDEASSADWIIGVDDDEQVESDWLAHFIEAFETLGADIIVAARHLIYAETTSPFIERTQQYQLLKRVKILKCSPRRISR